MLIVPLPAKPDWRSPPWVTLAIMLVCTVIYFGFQLTDDAREHAAVSFYQENGLADIELPRYVADLEQRGQSALADHLRPHLPGGSEQANPMQVLLAMQEDSDFMARLRADKIVRPDEPKYPAWAQARPQFDALWQGIFTLRYALHPNAPTALQVLMQLFMHGSVDHLLGNMAILFMVAYTVEALLGGWRFLAFYLLAGLGATLPDLIWPGEPGAVSLGASGAIAGVMAMFVVLYGWRRIRFFYWIVFYFNTVRAPALLVLPYWLGNEVWQRVSDPSSHVNYWAHFGGLLSGAALIALYRVGRDGRSAERLEHDDAADKLVQQRAAADEYLRRMDFGRAAQAYAALAVQQPDNLDLVLRGFRAASMQADNALLQQAMDGLFAASKTAPPKTVAAETAKAWRLLAERKLKAPALSAKDALRLLGGWIDAGEFAAAESLLPKLMARDQGIADAVAALLYRLGLAQRRAGNEPACQTAWRLLSERYPNAPEVRLLAVGL